MDCLEHVPGYVARRRACARVPASPKMYPSRTRRDSNFVGAANTIGHLQGFYTSPLTDSNRRPPPYHGGALPAELRGQEHGILAALDEPFLAELGTRPLRLAQLETHPAEHRVGLRELHLVVLHDLHVVAPRIAEVEA